MYITRLHVKNMKLMRDLAFDFTYEGKPRLWTAFVAENGACKTTLLQAIALAASGPERSNQLADVPALPDLRRVGAAVQIDANFEFGPSLERWRLFPKSESPLESPYIQGLRSTLTIGTDQSTFSGTSWPTLPENARATGTTLENWLTPKCPLLLSFSETAFQPQFVRGCRQINWTPRSTPWFVHSSGRETLFPKPVRSPSPDGSLPATARSANCRYLSARPS
ncbi:hypothetical protein [Archangium violaceum]|uniref:hypothetical protein n=1 Tax=Archangium violaceum TaxID=83451 RepID=UPI001362C5DB|nr:hypothetical protein [Archangium violaceum]